MGLDMAKLVLRACLNDIVAGINVQQQAYAAAENLQLMLQNLDKARLARAHLGGRDGGTAKKAYLGDVGFYRCTRYNAEYERTFEFFLPEGADQSIPQGVTVNFYFRPTEEGIRILHTGIEKMRETSGHDTRGLAARLLLGNLSDGAEREKIAELHQRELEKQEAMVELARRGLDGIHDFSLYRVETVKPNRRLPFIGRLRLTIEGYLPRFGFSHVETVYSSEQ